MRYQIAISGLLLVSSLFANPVVVATLGETTPIDQYLGSFLQNHIKVKKVTDIKASVIDSLTVKTAGLSVGKVKSRAINVPMLEGQPIYLIGDDAVSLKWLSSYADRLKKIHATGLMVNVSNPKILKFIMNRYGLHIVPVNASKLAQQYQIKHYPVLISSKRIEQ